MPTLALRTRTIVCTAVGCAVFASLALTATYHRVYRAEATLVLRADLDPLDEVVLLRSESLRTTVAARLGTTTLPPEPTITARAGTQQIDIVVRSGDAFTAAAVANAYAATYIDARGAAADTSAHDQAVADVDASIIVAEQAIATLDGNAELSSDDEVLRQLFVDQLADLRVQLAELEAAAPGGTGALEAAATLQPKATLPGTPEQPRVVRRALFAAAAGLLIGLGAILVAGRADDTLQRSAELGTIRRRIPIIGRIPHDGSLAHRPLSRRRRIDDISATSVNALRDEVLFLGLEPPTRVILICSASPGAGATTVATELAIALSDYSSVVLVDLDLRSPQIHEMLGMDDTLGVVDNLNAESIDMTLYPVEERLSVIAAGRPQVRPLGMLSRVRLDEMMAELRDRYDVVVLDAPNLETYGDATMIARLADAVIVVARLGHTSATSVRSACRELERVGAPIMGFVVNDA